MGQGSIQYGPGPDLPLHSDWTMTLPILFIFCSYLLGACPFGLLMARAKGIASIASAIAVAVAAWAMFAEQSLLLPIVFSLLAVLIVWKHRTNLSRLMRGEEHRFNTFKRTSKQRDNL